MPAGRAPGMPGAGPAGGTQPAAPAANAEGGPQRTEFVILFVWKEPTFSDGLRGQTVAVGGAGGSTVGASPGTNTEQPPPSRPRRNRGGRNKQRRN